MRITRDLLLSLARDNTTKLAAKDRSLVCVYLVGSLLREDPFLGGLTDIDMVCVHDKDIKPYREIVRINSDLHLDLTHLPQSQFDNTRAMRADPWIGGSLDECTVALRDSQHWFDYTRANVTGAYWKPEFIYERVKLFASRARQTFQQLADEALPQGLKRTEAFLDALNDAANAVACFNGSPLTTRRLLLDLPECSFKIALPDLVPVFISLFSSEAFNEANWAIWMPQWLAAFDAVKGIKNTPLEVVETRRKYFEKAASVFAVEHPGAALWIMLRTWTSLASVLPKSEPPYKEWQAFTRALNLDGRGLPARIEGLDKLLESVENVIVTWQNDNI